MKHIFVKWFIALLCGLHSSPSKACRCTEYYTSVDSLSQLKHYDFIAHVKITDDQDYKTPADNFGMIGQLTFQIIELFKGQQVDKILEYSKKTSCDIGVSIGEEWILFGTIRDCNLSIGSCDRNLRYQKVNGLKDWKYGRGIRQIGQLRVLYQHKIRKYGNESHKEYYPNGQIEIEETYVNGLKNGDRKIWYPNGILFGREYYINDSLDGKTEWFYPSGQIYDEDFYTKGKPCNVSRIYHDSSFGTTYKKSLIAMVYKTEDSLRFVYNRVQVQYEVVYDSYGREIMIKEYTLLGKLHREETLDPDRVARTTIYYHENGNISSIQYSLNHNGIGHYQEYDKNGVPSRGWDYDENGRVINPPKSR
jgi:antitoxin component YwqK of YwqJK toxin-antitoxin module